MDLTHGLNPIDVHGQPLGSAHGLLFSGDLADVSRPVPRVKKAKKLNLPPSFHPECYPHYYCDIE